MIAFLAGEIAEKKGDSLVVMVGGVGIEVFVPSSVQASVMVGEEVRLHTHMHVREKEISLYGFATREEADIFRSLLGVSGVGPKNALSILSSMGPDALRTAVWNEDVSRLKSVPGIGAKTARKIILEMKDRIGAPEGAPESFTSLGEVDAQVIEALTALGYSLVEAQRAVQMVPPDVHGLEDRLRAALAAFGR